MKARAGSGRAPERDRAPGKWSKEHLDERFRLFLGDDADDSKEARKRRRILRAAYELFLSQGYRRTSVDQVARKAEVAKGTVYLYFENKGALLLHAIALEKKVLVKRLEPLFSGAIPREERLHYAIVLALTSARELPLSARLMTGDTELWAALEDIGSDELTYRREEGLSYWTEMIEQTIPGVLDEDEKRARADVIIALGFCSAMLLDERVRGARSLDDLARTLADMLVHGLAGPRAGAGGRAGGGEPR